MANALLLTMARSYGKNTNEVWTQKSRIEGKEDSTHEAPSLTEELWRALALEEKESIKSMVHLSLKVDSTPSVIYAERTVFNGLFLKQEKIYKVGERRQWDISEKSQGVM